MTSGHDLYVEAVAAFERAGGAYGKQAHRCLCANLAIGVLRGTWWAKRSPDGQLEAMCVWHETDAEGLKEALHSGMTERVGGDGLFFAELFNRGGKKNLLEFRRFLLKNYSVRPPGFRVGWLRCGELQTCLKIRSSPHVEQKRQG